MEEARALIFENEFVSLVVGSSNQDEVLAPTFLPRDSDGNIDIYIICSSEDIESCTLLYNIIMSHNNSFVVKISFTENASTRLTYLDKARLVIPLLSCSFMRSSELVHELNIGWCRQRECSRLCFLAIILEQLPKSPAYINLFPCFFNCTDSCWTKDRETLKLFSAGEITQLYRNCQCRINVLFCLLAVTHHIQKWHTGDNCPVLGMHNKLFNWLQLNRCIKHYKKLHSNYKREVNIAMVGVCGGFTYDMHMIDTVGIKEVFAGDVECSMFLRSQDSPLNVQPTEESKRSVVKNTKSLSGCVVKDDEHHLAETNGDGVQNATQNPDKVSVKEMKSIGIEHRLLETVITENSVLEVKKSQQEGNKNPIRDSRDSRPSTQSQKELITKRRSNSTACIVT